MPNRITSKQSSLQKGHNKNTANMLLQESHMIEEITPLHAPECLEKYHSIDPSFSNRILVMAEEQSKSQINASNTNIKTNAVLTTITVVAYWLVIFASIYLVYLDKAKDIAKILLIVFGGGAVLPAIPKFIKDIINIFTPK